MHELSIAENILEIVDRHRQEQNFERLKSVTLRLGLLSGVDEDALCFAFEALTEGGPYDGAALEVEKTFPQARCSCGHCFVVEDILYACPKCGSVIAELTGGDELNIIELEVY
ncbi:MAG TPA: hydrogenase maturation nickel metallochaperone HypA [archaeon]|nr:hydrogenase maturation nickel metallochaperone HypA [archaeon]